MVRQISASPPNASSIPAEPSDLGRWLTRELRVKGAPLPSRPPPSESPPVESPRSEPAAWQPAEARPRDERESLAGWLTRDLNPRHGVRSVAAPSLEPFALETSALARRPLSSNEAPFSSAPSIETPSREAQPSSDSLPTEAPPSEAPALRREPFLREPSFADQRLPLPEHARSIPLAAPSAAHLALSSVASPNAGRLAPPLPSSARAQLRASLPDAPPSSDVPSLMEVPPTSVALATSQPPSALAPVGLEEDDLAVLPGRRRANGSRRAKLALGLLLGLLLVGVLLVVRFGQGPVGDREAAANDRPPADNGVLLPPPPSSDAPLSAPEATVVAPAPRRANAAREEAEGPMDPRDPRFMRGGPNTRRYADVPSPTLSRLAREQRRLAAERDEAARNLEHAKP
jgi:hypothetical protein